MQDQPLSPRPAGRRRVSRRVLLAALTLTVVGGALGAYRTTGWAQSAETYDVIAVDFATPDVVVRTRSLSSLFRDLLRVPLAQALLGEDVLFHYESNADRLGLMGALRRISYEHNVSWTDQLISTVFDEPADVMLWRGPKGALDHWAIAMTRGIFATALQEAATVAAKDRQLSRLGELTVDGATVPVYALEYAPARTLFVAARGDRIVVLSDPGLVGDGAGGFRGAPATAVGNLLSGDESRRGIFNAALPLDRPELTHSVAARLHFLSFGYQRFFPAVDALKFDFGGGQWSTSLLVNGTPLPATPQGSALWGAVPVNAALCATLPVDWSRGREIAAGFGADSEDAATPVRPDDLWRQLTGPALACWYEQAPLHTPLIVATLASPRPDLDALLTRLYDWSVKRPEDSPAVAARRTAADETWWQRDLEVPFSTIDRESGRPQPRTLQVTLAVKGTQVFFSPDGDLVGRALDTAGRRFPSMADTLPRDGVTLMTLAPSALATLGRREAMLMLPQSDEPDLRAAAEQQLLPRFDRIAAFQPYRLTLTPNAATSRRWEPVTWQALPQ